jgi:hypothetical protein
MGYAGKIDYIEGIKTASEVPAISHGYRKLSPDITSDNIHYFCRDCKLYIFEVWNLITMELTTRKVLASRIVSGAFTIILSSFLSYFGAV